VSRRRTSLASLAVLAAVVAAGCSSPPPPKEVAIEMIESLRNTDTGAGVPISDAAVDCMLAKVNNDYTEDMVAAIAGADQLSLDGFSADLATCLTAGS